MLVQPVLGGVCIHLRTVSAIKVPHCKLAGTTRYVQSSLPVVAMGLGLPQFPLWSKVYDCISFSRNDDTHASQNCVTMPCYSKTEAK